MPARLENKGDDYCDTHKLERTIQYRGVGVEIECIVLFLYIYFYVFEIPRLGSSFQHDQPMMISYALSIASIRKTMLSSNDTHICCLIIYYMSIEETFMIWYPV